MSDARRRSRIGDAVETDRREATLTGTELFDLVGRHGGLDPAAMPVPFAAATPGDLR